MADVRIILHRDLRDRAHVEPADKRRRQANRGSVLSVGGGTLPFSPAPEGAQHIDHPGWVGYEGIAQRNLVSRVAADGSRSRVGLPNIRGRKSVLPPRFREPPKHGVLFCPRPIDADVRSIAYARALSGCGIVPRASKRVARSGWVGIQRGGLHADRVKERGGNTVVGEGIANVSRSTRIQPCRKGIVDNRKRAIGVERLREIPATLESSRQCNNGGGWRSLPQSFITPEKEESLRTPDGTREIPSELIALKDRFRCAGAIVGPGVGIED